MALVIYGSVPIITPNEITKENKKFYISYNSSSRDYGHDTTALHISETSQFLILNGDHTKQYDNCSSLKDCVDYFYSQADKINQRSEHGKIFRFIDDKPEYVDGGY